MYDRGIIRERLAAVSKQLNFTLTRHALVDVQHANERLNRIYDPEKGQPIRPLHPHEKQWIQNERAYCMCDFLYWARRYGYILDSQDRLVRFRPNVAQRIILDVWAELEHVRRGIEIQEGKARQLGVCLDPSTRVLTADLRWLSLAEIKCGQAVVSVEEHPRGRGTARKMQIGWVQAKHEVVEEAYELLLDNGVRLIATGLHRFLAKRRGGVDSEWKPVKHLEVGDSLRCICSLWGEPGYEDGWIGGMLDGEGCLRAKNRAGVECSVSQVYGAVYDRLLSYMRLHEYSYREEVDRRLPENSQKFGRTPVAKIVVGRMGEIFCLIGQTRPTRFLARAWWEEKELPGRKTGKCWACVVSIRNLGKRQMVDLQTSTQTFIAEGFVSHNSTLTELAVAHRVQFYPNVNAVVASSDPSKSAKLAQMMERAWDNQPWWLMPERTVNKAGELIEFGYQNSGISIQHGAQFTGIARGDAPTVCHLSEVSEFINPEELVDASLFPAMHPSLWLFLMLESTAKKLHDWWHDSWNYNKANWASGRSRLRTVFLPWFVGTDIWPNASWVRDHPVPSNWKIPELIVKHAERAQAYVQQSDLLRKHLGENWSMPIEQMWFYEVTREEYKAKHELAKFYCVSGNTLISSEQGILPICEAQSVKRVETGEVGSWFVRGKRSVVTVRTKNGREITCTPDHRFYTTNQEWVSAEQLKTGDLIRLCVPSFRTDSFVKTWNWFPGCQMSTTIDDNWSRFIGYFLGDGSWFGDTVEIACARRDPDTVEDVCNLCRKLTGANPTLKTKKGCVQVRSFSTKWWQVLWALGLLDRRVLKKQNRHSGYRKRCRVPECIFKSPRSIIAQFLRGLFEADGCSSRTAVQIGFFAKSPEFTREVQLLLLGFGINSNIRPVKKVTKDGREYFGNTMWLNAEAAEVFFREIGFVSERKNSGKRHVHPKMGRHRIPNRLEDTIESVTPAGEEDVYDISVPSVCSFGANGILAHNSEFPADDIEMFQSPNLGVFEPDLIAEYNESTKPPKAVFGFTGACVPLRIQPDRREIDTNQRPIHLSRRLPQGGTFDCTLVPLHFQGYAETDFTNKLFVWEFAEKGCDYGIGVDTSDGVGQDRSVMEVVCKGDSQRNDLQCAEFASAYINAFDLAPLVYAVGCLYSPDPECQPKMVIECNRNGQATQLEVRKMGWMNFHQWMPRYDKKRLSQARANYLGWGTNARTRPLMMDNLVRMLRDGWIDVLSPWLVDEMRDLERDEAKQRLASCYGGHDDRIMSLAAVLWSLHALELQGTQRGMLFERMQRQSDSNIAVYPLYNPQTAYSRPIQLEGDEYGR